MQNLLAAATVAAPQYETPGGAAFPGLSIALVAGLLILAVSVGAWLAGSVRKAASAGVVIGGVLTAGASLGFGATSVAGHNHDLEVAQYLEAEYGIHVIDRHPPAWGTTTVEAVDNGELTQFTLTSSPDGTVIVFTGDGQQMVATTGAAAR